MRSGVGFWSFCFWGLVRQYTVTTGVPSEWPAITLSFFYFWPLVLLVSLCLSFAVLQATFYGGASTVAGVGLVSSTGGRWGRKCLGPQQRPVYVCVIAAPSTVLPLFYWLVLAVPGGRPSLTLPCMSRVPCHCNVYPAMSYCDCLADVVHPCARRDRVPLALVYNDNVLLAVDV